jgi:cytochrome P450
MKTILATDFHTWSLGQARIAQMTPYVGKGIFTTEGAEWKHSREMLRPSFERSQVADVSLLEKHVCRLLSLIPKDGTTIDLQPLFHHLTLDIATEFLFGRSTNALDNSEDRKEVEEFIEAFEYCQNPFQNENSKKWGFLGMFLPDWKFKRCAKVIEGMLSLFGLMCLQYNAIHDILPTVVFFLGNSHFRFTHD